MNTGGYKGNIKFNISKDNYEKQIQKNLIGRDSYLDKEECIYTKNMIKRRRNIPVLFNDVNESVMFMNYELIIHGITPCGSKTTIIIEGVSPSVDVEYDKNISKEDNTKRIQNLLTDKNLLKKLKNKAPEVKSMKMVSGKKLIGFSEEESVFIRLYFKNLYHRNEFIKNITKKGISTYNNDTSSYYRVVARQYKLALSGWNIISKYNVGSNRDKDMFKSCYVLRVDIDDILKYDENEIHEFGYNQELFRNDKTISMAFDIEQYSSDFDINNPNIDTRIPSGKIMEDTIFNIGMTFHFINADNSVVNIGLITEDCEPHEDYVTIVCESEKVLLLAFSYIIGIMMPDYIFEFNGSGFDWPNIYDKSCLWGIEKDICRNMSIKTLNDYDLRKENLEKYIYATDFIKISADMTDQRMVNIRLQGYIAFDSRLILMQLNPTESKSSLKFYLELYDLGSKDDMPIKKLFKYFITKDYEGLGEVNHYCYIDCFRLHELIRKVNIIPDRRAVGLLSYTSLFDAFYRANSSKVRNLIVSHALDKNLFYNSIKKEVKEEDFMDGKYCGALVLNPKRGLVSPLLNFEDFCKEMLGVSDESIIEEGQKIIDENFDKVYIEKDFSTIKF
jgi:DNA polymerase elongation subunit (family B)